MVRAFRWAVFRDVAGACRPPAERRGGGRAAQSPEGARHERLRLRLANGIRTTLEDGALYARRTGGVRPKAEVQNRPSNVGYGSERRFAAMPQYVRSRGQTGLIAHIAKATVMTQACPFGVQLTHQYRHGEADDRRLYLRSGEADGGRPPEARAWLIWK